MIYVCENSTKFMEMKATSKAEFYVWERNEFL